MGEHASHKRAVGGCDGLGGVYDACGVCAGDNSTCECVKYLGYDKHELQYALVEWSVDQTKERIDNVMDVLLVTMEVLEEYSGPGDLGVMIQYFNDFCETCITDYSTYLDKFTFSLKQSVGLISKDSVLEDN